MLDENDLAESLKKNLAYFFCAFFIFPQYVNIDQAIHFLEINTIALNEQGKKIRMFLYVKLLKHFTERFHRA